MLKRIRLDWPQVAVVGIVAAAFVGSYFLPPDVREELRADLGWIWGAVSTVLGPIVRRRLAEPDK